MITLSLVVLIAIYTGLHFLYKIEEDKLRWNLYGLKVGNLLLALLVGCSIYYGFGYSRGYDSEYWGSYTTRAVYEEDWNEYIHQTCSRQVPSGTDSNGNTTYTTEFYDCSYVQYHPEKWWIQDNIGTTFSVRKEYYSKLHVNWRNQRKTGHHSGYTNSGDIYEVSYTNHEDVLDPLVIEHSYFNRVDASDSVFKFKKITKEEAKNIGLYEYPNPNGLYTPTVLGYTSNKKLDNINALLGSYKQIRVWVLVFHDKMPITGIDQRDYWHNGNKNELVICIGLTKEGVVGWCNIFSWCEQDEFIVHCREEVMKQYAQPLNLDALADYLRATIPLGWKRKEFKDFDYLSINPSTKVLIFTAIFTILVGLAYPVLHIMIHHEHTKQSKNSLRVRYLSGKQRR